MPVGFARESNSESNSSTSSSCLNTTINIAPRQFFFFCGRMLGSCYVIPSTFFRFFVFPGAVDFCVFFCVFLCFLCLFLFLCLFFLHRLRRSSSAPFNSVPNTYATILIVCLSAVHSFLLVHPASVGWNGISKRGAGLTVLRCGVVVFLAESRRR